MTAGPLISAHGDPPVHLTFAALDRLGLPHLSTTRRCPGITQPADTGSPLGPAAVERFAGSGLDLSRATFLRQVHEAGVRRVDGEAGGFVGEGDILLTETPGVPLAIFTADCLSIILFDPVGRRLAVAHVGWRGTKQARLTLITGRSRSARRRLTHTWRNRLTHSTIPSPFSPGRPMKKWSRTGPPAATLPARLAGEWLSPRSR